MAAANRRELLLGLGAGLLAGATGGLARAAAPGSYVLYVSALDCASCRRWEADQRAAFMQGLQKNGVGFRTVVATSYFNVREDRAWPADLKWLLAAYPQMKGTPWFYVISGGTVQVAANGVEQWRHLVARLAA